MWLVLDTGRTQPEPLQACEALEHGALRHPGKQRSKNQEAKGNSESLITAPGPVRRTQFDVAFPKLYSVRQ